MKKLFTTVLAGMLIAGAGACFADEVYYVNTTNYKPTLLDKIEDSTQDMAEATADAAQKTGNFIKDKSKTAADATGKAVKCGAKKTKRAVRKAGHATKQGAKKATNWSATKIRNGAEKIIIKTEDTPNVETSDGIMEE